MKALHVTFDEVDATAEVLEPTVAFLAFRSQQHIFCQPSFLSSQLKRRHWLLAAGEIGKPAMQSWLAGVPAVWGSAGEGGGFIDTTPGVNGWMCGGDCAEGTSPIFHYFCLKLSICSV